MNIRIKFIIPFSLLLVLLIGSFLYILIYLQNTRNQINQNNSVMQRVNDFSTRMYILQENTQKSVLAYRFNKDTKYLSLIENNPQEVNSLIQQIRPYITSQTGTQLLMEFEKSRENLSKTRSDLVNAININDEREISKNFNKWEILSENSSASLLDFTNYNLHSLERINLLYDDMISRIYYIATLLTFLTLLLIGALYFYFSKIITQPIQLLSAAAEKISQGKFNINIANRSNDELGILGKNIEEMAGKLKNYYKVLQNEVKNKEEEIKRNKAFESQKDDFMSIASHELKTPVTSLKVYGMLMQQIAAKNNDHKYDKYLLKINEQVVKLTGLISSLLDVTKMKSGQLPLTKSLFDLSNCVRDKIEIIQETAKGHRIILNGSLNSKVYGDEDRICQVVDNLIANAVKYSPKGGKVLVNLSNDKKEAKVSVQDFGIGIDIEHQKKIFDRFYRVADINEKTFPGLGIELYITNEIIKRHNGKLWVESVKGKGSTFSFTIPLRSDSI